MRVHVSGHPTSVCRKQEAHALIKINKGMNADRSPDATLSPMKSTAHCVPSKPRHVIGVCALEAKSRSKPMRNILDRILASNSTPSNPFHFEILLFSDQMILNESPEQWPPCDSLIAFYSMGFPLEKAVQYQRRLGVFCVNDLVMQAILQDRRLVQLILEAIDVPTAKRVWLNRPLDTPPPQVTPELAELVSRDFNVDIASPDLYPIAERMSVPPTQPGSIKLGREILHRPFVEKPANADNHNIYIYNADGTATKLFRKIGNKCSELVEDELSIRGSIGGDEGLQGTSFVYEEFLPVDNGEDIKVYTVGPNYAYAEIRKSPFVDGIVTRNAQGKEIRVPIVLTEEEHEIGRRVAMAFGQTVCGFDMIRSRGRPYVLDVNGWSFVKGSDVYYDKAAKILRETLIQVARRKRKSSTSLKLNASAVELPSPKDEHLGRWHLAAFIAIFRHADRTPKQKIKMPTTDAGIVALFDRTVKKGGSEECLITGRECLFQVLEICRLAPLQSIVQVLERKYKIPGTKVQLRRLRCDAILIILKWGGEFTHAGRHQSKDVADNLRQDLHILNRKILDDVRVWSSGERRAQATAQVFMKALLPLSELPDNLVAVKEEWLDDKLLDRKFSDSLKERISAHFRDSALVAEVMCDLRRHRKVFLKQVADPQRLVSDERWCCSESPVLFCERWEKHFDDILGHEEEVEVEVEGEGKGEGDGDGSASPDMARFNDLYDSIRYDAIHHRGFLLQMFVGGQDDLAGQVELSTSFKRLYTNLHLLSNQLRPLELGFTREERTQIARQVAGNLLNKVLQDVGEVRTNEAFTRLYFTKEGQITALMEMIQVALGDVHEENLLLEYLSQICLEVYKKPRSYGDAPGDANGFSYSVRVGVSMGANDPHLFQLQLDSKHAVRVAKLKWLTDYLNLAEFLEKFAVVRDQA